MGGGIKNSSRKSKRGRIESAPGRTCQKVNERKIDGQWEVNELERGGRLYTGGAFFFFSFYLFSASRCHSVLTASVTFTAR